MQCLILIDFQYAFINKHTEAVVLKTKEAIKSKVFKYVIFTTFVNKADSSFVKNIDYKKCFKSPDTDIVPLLLEFSNKNNTFSRTAYSVFKSKKLVKFLKENNIEEITLAGLDTDACVLASAYDAFDLGFKVSINEKLSGSTQGISFHKKAVDILKRNIDRGL